MESDLIHRIENAREGQESDALADAWDYCAKIDSPHDRAALAEKAGRFAAMLNAKAWTSAAEMLVPEGWYYAVAKDSAGAMAAVAPVPDCSDITRGPFPWAALAAASVKARG